MNVLKGLVLPAAVIIAVLGFGLSIMAFYELWQSNAELEHRVADLMATLQVTPTPTGTPTNTATHTPTATATPTSTATSTPTNTPTVTPIPTNTRWPTNTPIPTNTPLPTNTPGPDPERQFYDGIDAMCRAANGMLLELFFIMPFDCHEIVTGGQDLDWFNDDDFHKTATPRPTRPSPTLPPSSLGFES